MLAIQLIYCVNYIIGSLKQIKIRVNKVFFGLLK
jgi:hypothetical protein